MIDNNISQSERLEKLNIIAIKELSVLSNDRNVIGLEQYDINQNIECKKGDVI